MEEAAQDPTTDVLIAAWLQGFSTKSDLARTKADWVAIAASRGYLTTQLSASRWGRSWHITPAGLEELWDRLGINE